jgi:AraC-like DNA-binding protein
MHDSKPVRRHSARAVTKRAGSRQPTGGVLALTTRNPVRERLRTISERLDLPHPVFVERLEEIMGAGSQHPVLLLDLGTCARDHGLEMLVQSWAAGSTAGEVVVLLPPINREAEFMAAMSLVAAARYAQTRVMTSSDFDRDEVWYNLKVATERSALAAELRAELLAVVGERGIRSESLVLQILDDAPRAMDIQAVARAVVTRGRVNVDTPRKTMWRALHASGQLPASWLLIVFRVLWYTKLNERGWSAGRIAEFLGFPSPRHLRLTVKRRFGMSMERLKDVRYADALAWAATLVVSPCAVGDAVEGVTARNLIGPLLEAPARREKASRDQSAPHCDRSGLSAGDKNHFLS